MSQELNLPERLEEWANGPIFLSDTAAVKAVLRIAADRIRELERAQPAGEAEVFLSAYRLGAPLDEAFAQGLRAAPPAAANQAGIPEGWISVNEKMPTGHFYGLAALTTGTVIPAGYGPLFGWQWDETDTDEDADAAVTHWMPFAAAPHPTESHALGGGDTE